MFFVASIIFVAVAVAVVSFGAAAYAPTSTLGARLESLGFDRPAAAPKASVRERLDKVFDPISRALPLSSGDKSRTWLIQAGFRERRHLVIYAASKVFGAAALFGIAVAVGGFDSTLLLVGAVLLGLFLPRF